MRSPAIRRSMPRWRRFAIGRRTGFADKTLPGDEPLTILGPLLHGGHHGRAREAHLPELERRRRFDRVPELRGSAYRNVLLLPDLRVCRFLRWLRIVCQV